MAGVHRFIDLISWQKARAWSKAIYQQTQHEKFSSDRRLTTQINDSSSSVMANIAEGFGRGTQGEFITFLGYAIGSLNETQSHLAAAFDRGFIASETYAELFENGTEIRRLIVAFMQSMTKAGTGVKNLRKYKSWSEEVWQTDERVTGKPRPWLANKPDSPDSNAIDDAVHEEPAEFGFAATNPMDEP